MTKTRIVWTTALISAFLSLLSPNIERLDRGDLPRKEERIVEKYSVAEAQEIQETEYLYFYQDGCLIAPISGSMGLDVIMSEELSGKDRFRPMHLGYFMDKAKAEYGDRLVGLITGTFYDTKKFQSVGRIIRGGNLIAEGNYDGGYLVYDGGAIELHDNYSSAWERYDFVEGGLAWLRSNGVKYHEPRRLDLHSNIHRVGIGIDENRNASFVCYKGRANEFNKRLERMGFDYFLMLDSGNSAKLVIFSGAPIKLVESNPERKLINMIAWYKTDGPQ